MTVFCLFSGPVLGPIWGPKRTPTCTENQSKSERKLDCINNTKIEVEKRNVEGLSFGLKLESLCTNKRKGILIRSIIESSIFEETRNIQYQLMFAHSIELLNRLIIVIQFMELLKNPLNHRIIEYFAIVCSVY